MPRVGAAVLGTWQLLRIGIGCSCMLAWHMLCEAQLESFDISGARRAYMYRPVCHPTPFST